MIESSDEGGDVSTEEGSEEEGAVDKAQAGKVKEMSTLASTESVFPFKSIPLVIAGISKNYLPFCSPQTQSCYHCQVPQCTLVFSQKAATCNHVQNDHLNLDLACLYCSFEDNPKMHWYSATAWEDHTMKHLKDNLPIFPDDPALLRNSYPNLVVMLLLALQNKFYLMRKGLDSEQEEQNHQTSPHSCSFDS